MSHNYLLGFHRNKGRGQIDQPVFRGIADYFIGSDPVKTKY